MNLRHRYLWIALWGLGACHTQPQPDSLTAPSTGAESLPPSPPKEQTSTASVRPVPNAKDKAHAEEIWAQRCVLCHGASGQGNGIAAVNLKPHPRNLQDPNWQQDIDDATIGKVIVQGGPGIGKSMMMPSNPDLATEPKIVQALIEHIRGLKP